MNTNPRNAVIYAVQALRLHAQSPVGLNSDDVARKLDISLPYAEKIHRLLRGAGLLRASGTRQGYLLTRELRDITIADAVLGIDAGLGHLLQDAPQDTEPMRAIRTWLRESLTRQGWGVPLTRAP
jgi:DNA-binding IscR family transcriptional regulator